MAGHIGSGRARYHHVLTAMVLVLLLALPLGLFLPGCGGENAAVKKQDERTETRREEEVVLEDEEVTDTVEEEGEEDYEESMALDEEYTNDKNGFSLSYPEGWECEDLEEGDGCKIADPHNDRVDASAWALPAGGKSAEDWLDNIFEVINANYVATGDWVVDRDPSNSVHDTYNGADYAYEYWTYETGGVDYYCDVMVMVEGDEAFCFTAQYPVDDVEEIGPIVDAMIDSYTLPGW